MGSTEGGARPLLRIWIDAQLPPALARWMAEEHVLEVRHVLDEGFLTADDRVIFEAARVAGVAAVVTKDEDFVHLLERFGPPPQVVWVTVGNVSNAELRRVIREAWPAVVTLLRAGEPLIEIGRRIELE